VDKFAKSKSRMVTANFSDFEIRYLHQWNRLADPSDGLTHEIWANLVRVAEKLEEIRNILGVPLVITSWYRPLHYNHIIGGAKRSAHVEGLAVDFRTKGMSCDRARELLEPLLEDLGIRMERNPGSSWVHIDLRKPIGERYFLP